VSSTTYSAELLPDPALRQVVIGTGILAAAAGAAAAATLPVSWPTKLIAVLGWVLFSGRELLHIAWGNKACSRLQIDASGNVQIFDSAGACRPARVDSGSVVLRRIAWLRLQTPEGRRHGELLRPESARIHEWRRFRVIWRHLGAVARSC
jgi:hypothetical protein